MEDTLLAAKGYVAYHIIMKPNHQPGFEFQAHALPKKKWSRKQDIHGHEGVLHKSECTRPLSQAL